MQFCSRYFICSKSPKSNVKLCSGFTQNEDEEDAIWEQRLYEIAKDVAASIAQCPPGSTTCDSIVNSAIKIADKLIERLKEK